MRFSSASWWRGSTRKQLLHRNSFSRRGTILVPPSPRLVGLVVLVLVLFEARGDGALAQHDVERLLDVVGVELLVEVDDVVLFVLVSTIGSAAGTTSTPGTATTSMISASIVVDEVVVEDVVVVDEVLLEHVLVEVFLVELGLVLELVVAHVLGAFLRGKER